MEGSVKSLEVAILLATFLVSVIAMVIAGMFGIFKLIERQKPNLTPLIVKLTEDRIYIKTLIKEVKLLSEEIKLLKKTIKNDGEINKFSINTASLLSKKSTLNPVKKLPREWIRDIENALRESHEAVVMLEKSMTTETAKKACMANRKAMILLLLGWRWYVDKYEKTTQSLSDLERTYSMTATVAKRTENAQEKKVLYNNAINQMYWINALKAMLAGGVDKTSEILSEVCEQSYRMNQSDSSESPP